MQRGLRVAAPPLKPLLVFDGECTFCALWVRRWQQITGDRVDYLPAQDPAIATRFPEIPPKHFDSAVQLIETDGMIYSGAEAVFRTLAHNPDRQWPLRWHAESKPFAGLTEWTYRLVAENRTFFSRLTRWFWGRQVGPPDYHLTRWVFLRALGVIYLIAFISLWTQISGLIGHGGILPTGQFISDADRYCERHGIGLGRYLYWPTLCWLNASDGFLQFQCAAGAMLAGLLVLGVAPMPCLALLWLLYLSLVTAGRDFLGFQWDNLLLETGFLSIFFAPGQWLPKFGGSPFRSWSARTRPRCQNGERSPRSQGKGLPAGLVLWLLRLLLFKLVFSSGCVKLASGDPAWRNHTALAYHYQTQPLPSWIGWYAQQLPLGFQKFSCAVMFGVELGAPFLIFAPRRLRFLGGAAIACLQILILLTGNYTFFNWLTLALCLLLLDDQVLMKFVPSRLREIFAPATAHSVASKPGGDNAAPAIHSGWPKAVTVPLAAVVLGIYLLQINLALGRQPIWLFPAAIANIWLAPLRTLNSYGLFAVMTTDRREIIVQGSNDGTNWLTYEFDYKPGDANRRPAFVAPHQPRLDWQMWFAALGDFQQNPWFADFCQRLLQGSPEVLALLAKNPFPDRPPRYVRAELYDYRFTTPAERRATGAWWKREFIGEYLPPISLRE
jgi:lipase maturation factor 1